MRLKIYALVTSIFLLAGLAPIISNAQPAGWTYRLPITVVNTGSATMYDAVVPIYVNTQSLISASQMQSTGSDVRFGTPCYGSTLFDYYIDSGLNSSSTKFLVHIDTLLVGSNTIFMFYDNPSAAPVSAPTTNIFQNGPHSAINGLSGGNTNTYSNCQRGFKFSTNMEILVTSLGKNTPNSTQRYVTLFDASTQGIVVQDTVSGAASTYSYANLFPASSPPYTGIALGVGKSYTLEVFNGNNDQYYYQTSSSIAPQLTYSTMLYCNTCTQNTYPNTTLSNYQYGYPDMQFYVLDTLNPMPSVTVGIGTVSGNPPNIVTQPTSASVCVGNNATFSLTATGTGLTYQWQVNTGNGFTNVTNSILYSGANSATLHVFNIGSVMNGYTYKCIVAGSACASATSNIVTLTINAPPAIAVQPLSASICPNNNASFSVTATGAALTYQWQENSGTGFHNIINGGVYTGATTNNLQLIGAPSTMVGDHYRCIITNICGIYDTTVSVVLTTYVAASIVSSPAPTDTICETSPAYLSVNATGSSLQYQWQINTGSGYVNMVNGGAISGVYSDSLIIIYVPLSMNGNMIRCVLTAGGCTPVLTTTATTLVVHALPNVTIQPAPNSTCLGGNATYTVGAVGYGLTYQWQVNTGSGFTNITNNSTYSGATTSALGITNVTSAMGTYTYKCVLNGTCGTSAYTNAVPLSINPPPTSSFSSSSSTTICPGDSILFQASQNPNYIYQWQINGNNIANATNPVYIASAAGNYTLIVGIGNGNCSDTSAAVAVTVLNAPTASLTASGPTTFCQGNTLTLSANTGPGLSYSWYLNNNLINNATSSSYLANITGTYYVHVFNGSCYTNSSPVSVTINPVPAATIIYTGTGYFCQGSTVVLNANSGINYSYQWLFNGASLGGATNSSFSTSTAGTYRVIVSNSYGCSDTSAPITLTAAPVPASSITASGPTSVCNGNTVLLNAPTGSNLTYQWDSAGVPIPSATNAYYNAGASGSYTVTITNLGGQGCSNTSAPISVTVSTTPLPPASITYSGNPVICFGDSLILNANTGTGYTYVWQVNGSVISGVTSSSYTAHNSGNYEVMITDVNGCVGTSSIINVIADTPLSPTIVKNGNILSTGAGYASYQWYRNGLGLSGATSYTYNTGGTPGTYTVFVSDSLGCTKMSQPKVLLGIDNVKSQGDIRVYPNPATSVVFIEAQGSVNVSITTIQGQTIIHKDAATELDISHLANGVYFIQIFDENNLLLKSERFVKNGQ